MTEEKTQEETQESLASRLSGLWIFGGLPLFIVAVSIVEYFGNRNPDDAFYISLVGYGAVAAFVGWVAYYMGRDDGRNEERRRVFGNFRYR